MDLEPLLNDAELGERAFRWVEQALDQLHTGSTTGVVLFPPLVPGVAVLELQLCTDYRCRCGWNLTLSGRNPVHRARLLALAARPPDERFGAFKVLRLQEHPGRWTLRIAGNDDLGRDAVIALLLAPVTRPGALLELAEPQEGRNPRAQGEGEGDHSGHDQPELGRPAPRVGRGDEAADGSPEEGEGKPKKD
jgi:hypothetical protein